MVIMAFKMDELDNAHEFDTHEINTHDMNTRPWPVMSNYDMEQHQLIEINKVLYYKNKADEPYCSNIKGDLRKAIIIKAIEDIENGGFTASETRLKLFALNNLITWHIGRSKL